MIAKGSSQILLSSLVVNPNKNMYNFSLASLTLEDHFSSCLPVTVTVTVIVKSCIHVSIIMSIFEFVFSLITVYFLFFLMN